MPKPGDFASALKLQADIVRIVGDYVKLKKAGAQNYSGLCPFHNEKTPSFSVHATRQFFHCFGCGASGDVFTFIQKIENITFPEAIRIIADKLGIPVPKVNYASPAEAKEARQRAALLEIHERACAFFQECLQRPESAHAREYLAGRGLDQETIARFRIGYAPDSGFLLRDRLRGEFGEELLRESGLFSWKQEEGRLQASGSTLQRQESRLEDDTSAATKQLQIPRSDHPLTPKAGALGTPIARDDNSRIEGNVPAAEGGGLTPGAGLPEAGRLNWQAGVPDAGRRVPEAASAEARSLKPGASSSLYSKFRNRIIFPIANESAKVIGFTGRRLSHDEKAGPKYLNSPETPIYSKSRVLFNLDQAKESIRKLDYAILVEGQMDCISVFAAGFRNVIASSGTAFSELQARLLGRFSKNVVVNFDPDTAGAKATERTLGLLVEEEFQVRVLTLEPGFDPDLFIRRKSKDAYEAALRNSQRYFDYLIERARSQFPVRSAEGKVKAVNYLLPHIQRVPSRIVRDELAHEIAQKLGIDSALLRQELRHAATSRSATTVQAPVEAQITEAERILVRALASATEMQTAEQHSSARDGAEEEFDPARQAQFVLKSERLHQGLATESLVDALLNPGPEVPDVVGLPLSDDNRRLLASILVREDEELTPDSVERAVRALRKKALNRRLKEIDRALNGPTQISERQQRLALAEERLKVKRALMDPGLAEEALAEDPKNEGSAASF